MVVGYHSGQTIVPLDDQDFYLYVILQGRASLPSKNGRPRIFKNQVIDRTAERPGPIISVGHTLILVVPQRLLMFPMCPEEHAALTRLEQDQRLSFSAFIEIDLREELAVEYFFDGEVVFRAGQIPGRIIVLKEGVLYYNQTEEVTQKVVIPLASHNGQVQRDCYRQSTQF